MIKYQYPLQVLVLPPEKVHQKEPDYIFEYSSTKPSDGHERHT